MARKLTTIFYADGVGSAAGMEHDEDAAVARVHRLIGLMDESFSRHGGRRINTWGDAVIAEFASVVEAVRCAVEVQEAIGAENALLAEPERLWMRIGINLGDIIVEPDGDVYGDGVNIAARIQELAEPGGVAVTKAAYDFAHRQLAVRFDFLGEKRVKSLSEPLAVYRARLGDGAKALPPSRRPAPSEALDRHGTLALIAGQSKGVIFSLMMISFFFLINLLFSDITTPWFIFPSFPFMVHALIWGRWKSRGPR